MEIITAQNLQFILNLVNIFSIFLSILSIIFLLIVIRPLFKFSKERTALFIVFSKASLIFIVHSTSKTWNKPEPSVNGSPER
ncbi:unnamed protein product [Meloidogyne enterolobii]|uniref:Uncharacterized protein n=1 Tax=Meloidogyne enterolobii TaxID=390850 RepID=A0ACB0Y7Q5_MELEN